MYFHQLYVIQNLHLLCSPQYLVRKEQILWLKIGIAIKQCNNNILLQANSHRLLTKWFNQK